MAKKRINLKQRLDELRNEPAPPVDIALQLDAALYRTLQAQAVQEGLALETYLVRLLARHAADE